jgi:NAD(P)-dependent dehydrogenase (short-subunit alcohol dehydrogenase family)
MYRSLLDLSGKVAVVTGGGKGIGLAITHALSELGAKTVLATRNMSTAQEGLEFLKSKGITPDTYEFDVLNPAAVTDAAKVLNERYGKVDVLVNNAGIVQGQAAEDVSDELFDWHF